MSSGVCLHSMPGNSTSTQQNLYRMSSQSTLSTMTFALPDISAIDATILNANKADPPLNFDEVGSFSFYIKLVQLFFSIVCAGLHSEGVKCIWDSTVDQLLPYIVCSVYMIINTVTVISYILGQKMPEPSMRIFAVIGCILFTAAGAESLSAWGRHEMMDISPAARIKLASASKMLVSEGFVALATAALYATDTCYSFQRTRSSFSPR
ncbi:uncharacterized protein [Hetaerina americana]|uniref:uncharacterized protein n=1 Tax=Hetaerina americana TaxID=62018 RepID=UPI003A7F3754